MSRKYLIETFGCQMNYHDSEQMAGLLESAGYERTAEDRDADVIVINTCSVRERAEDKLYTRLGELRDAGPGDRPRPVVAVAGCVAQQEGAALLKRSGLVDVIVGTRASGCCHCWSSRPPRPGSVQIDLGARDDVAFPFGVTRRSDPVRAWVTIIEGCNEYCSFCVVPYTRGQERMRPEGRHPGRSASRCRIRPSGGAAARADRESLPGAGRSVVRFRRAAGGGPRHTGRRADSVCEPAPAARERSPDRGDSRPAEGLQAPAPAGAVRLHARAAPRCGAATRASPISRSSSASGRRSRHRALDRHHRRISRGDGCGFRRDAVAGRSASGTTASSRSSTPSARTRSPRSGYADDVPEEEKTRRIVALQALQREIQLALHEAAVGHDVRRARRLRRAAGATRSSPAARRETRW